MEMPVNSTTPDDQFDLGEAVLLTGIVMSPGVNQAGTQLPEGGEEIIRRMAEATVRRKCNQHVCQRPLTGRCTHPDHRRDADYLSFVLGTLGLSQTHSPVTDDDRVNLLEVLGKQSTVGGSTELSED